MTKGSELILASRVLVSFGHEIGETSVPLVKTSSSGNEIVLNLCKFSNLRMRCDKEDGNIRRGNVNGKAHILQLKNRLETVIGGLFFICHILLATN